MARDKGYDPLVKPDPSPKTSSPASKELDRVRANLGKVEKNKRPRKKATLVKYVSTVFGNKLPKAELAELVDDMFRRKLVSEANNAISYHF